MTNNYMPHENRKTKIKCMSWECFNQTLNYYENKIRKKLNPKDFFRNAKQEFPGQSLESFSREYYNMKNKTLGFQFEPVWAKQARPNYSVGNPLRIQHDRLSTQEWYNCE